MADEVWGEFVGDFGDGQNVPNVQHSCGEKADLKAESVMFLCIY
jgi:hypothetical protein